MTTAIQLAFSAADVVGEVGFGMLIHEVAKLRTAEDPTAGTDTNPSPGWVDDEHLAAGLQPPLATSLADGDAIARPSRTRAPAR